jgi:hypothetical protein
MTIRKSFPPRDYETFPSSNNSEAGQGSSQTPASTDSDKTRLSAAHEAQRLASQGSWADNVFQTPGANLTPTTSTMGEQDRSGSQNDPNEYPSDPPPLYTPTDTTASTVPTSPVTARAEPVGTSQPPRRPSTPTLVTNEEVDEEQPRSGAYTPSSPLLERGEPNFFQHDSIRWKDGCKNYGMRRCKRAAWFTFALVACLWLMLPSLFYDKVPTLPFPMCSQYLTLPSAWHQWPSWPPSRQGPRRNSNPHMAHTETGISTAPNFEFDQRQVPIV